MFHEYCFKNVGRAALLFGVLLVTSFLFIDHAHAANRHWIGGTNTHWERTANWSASPRGATCTCVPSSSDIAIFSYSGGTIQMRSAINIQGLVLASNWTGSLLQGTGTLQVGSAGVKVGSGRLIGGNATIRVAATSGGFTMTGGIVAGLQSTTTLSGSLSITDGSAAGSPSFTATGTLIFDGTAQTLTLGTLGQITGLRVDNGSTTTLGANAKAIGTVTVNTGGILAMSSYTLASTGASITIYGRLNENTGKVVHTGTGLITGSDYSAQITTIDRTAYLQVTDGDENLSGSVLDTISVTLAAGTGDSETVTLSETSVSSGIFRGSIPAILGSYTAANGLLETAQNTTATLTFTDAEDALSSSDSSEFIIGAGTGNTGTSSGGSSGGGGGGGGRSTTATVTTTKQGQVVKAAEKKKTALEKRQERLERRLAMRARASARAALRKSKR